jgi:hypothetical protein
MLENTVICGGGYLRAEKKYFLCCSVPGTSVRILRPTKYAEKKNLRVKNSLPVESSKFVIQTCNSYWETPWVVIAS